MNELAKHNANRRREVETLRDAIVNTHKGRLLPQFTNYPFPLLRARIANALSERWGKGRLEPQIDLINRDTFGGDLALKLPQLTNDGGPAGFIKNHLPWIVEILEGEAFADAIAAVRTKEMSDNQRLLEIYRIRRTLERLVEDSIPFENVDEAERALLTRYFPEITDRETLVTAHENFVTASDARFAALEAGDADEVNLWVRMVEWSLKDFEQFYDSLGIHIDLALGESFYFQAGDELINECLKARTAISYTEADAETDVAEVDARLTRGEITQAERNKRAEFIRKDIGAVVIPLDDGERYVVRRADGLSIYATRDLGAIRLRRELFAPTDLTYVVGQEQRVHFSRLFKAANAIGIATPDEVRFHHVYFGFYVDARTGRKLSSRDTVANVNHLLSASVEHFRVKSAERGDLTPEELDTTARQLAVGSIVFNDLKQDVKGSAPIDTTALDTTIADFEKSGGAYVVSSACRARSILRKYGAEPPRAECIKDAAIDGQEATLLLKIQQIPERVRDAAEQSNPPLLVRHLLDIANLYNSYYMRVQLNILRARKI